MTKHYRKHTPEFIEYAISMATGGGRDDVPSLRPMARQLGLAHSTLRYWVNRATREAIPGQRKAPREQLGHNDSHRPDPRWGQPVASGDGHRGSTGHQVYLGRECERLVRDNAALKATLVVLARDLDSRP